MWEKGCDVDTTTSSEHPTDVHRTGGKVSPRLGWTYAENKEFLAPVYSLAQAPQLAAGWQHAARSTVLYCQLTWIEKKSFNSTWKKPRWNLEAILKNYGLFLYGDICVILLIHFV